MFRGCERHRRRATGGLINKIFATTSGCLAALGVHSPDSLVARVTPFVSPRELSGKRWSSYRGSNLPLARVAERFGKHAVGQRRALPRPEQGLASPLRAPLGCTEGREPFFRRHERQGRRRVACAKRAEAKKNVVPTERALAIWCCGKAYLFLLKGLDTVTS